MALTTTQLSTVIIVYLSSVLPALFIAFLYLRGRVPRWLVYLYLSTIFACAVGWELWLTYGLVDGVDVNGRRDPALISAVPMHINWILNSLADGAIGLFGVYLVWIAYRKTDTAFRRWHWGAFVILLTWFVAQNLFVELYVYQQQLAEGYRLSWAPLIPTGPWYNPVLLELGGRSVQLQTQLPWLLMAPIFYRMLLFYYARFGQAKL